MASWSPNIRADFAAVVLPGLLALGWLAPAFDPGSFLGRHVNLVQFSLVGFPHYFIALHLVGQLHSVHGWRGWVGPALIALALALAFGLGTVAIQRPLFGLLFFFSTWHTYRQHSGLLRYYERQRPGGKRLWEAVVLLAHLAPLAHFLGPALSAQSGPPWMRWDFPALPAGTVTALVALTLVLLVIAWARGGHPPRHLVPWIGSTVVLNAFLPMAWLGPDQFPRALAVYGTYHQLQYLTFTALRARRMGEAFSLRLWGAAVGFSVCLAGAIAAAGAVWGYALFFFFSFSHYWWDGQIWRRRNNPGLRVAV